jgi:hypothetical protein
LPKFISNTFFSFFFAPFFLWLCTGWYTLHCLRKREYFIIFSTHIYIGSIGICFACMYPSNHFLPLKQSSRNLSRYLNIEKSPLKNFAGTGDWTRVCNSQSCLWCIYCWIALMQTWNQRLVALEGGKGLIQHGPLGVAYHHRHPISTIPVARITAHATVPVNLKAILYLDLIWCQFPKLLKLRWT